jgi:hypothetical protein
MKTARKPPRAKPRSAEPARRDPIDAFIVAGARSLKLKIAKGWMTPVRMHLRVTLQHGTQVTDFALPDDAEPAPVFKA